MPTLRVPGAELHYETAGTGPSVLFLAGIASDSASWMPLLPRFTPHLHCVMPDNRGAGRTKAEGPLTLDQMVTDSAALIEALGMGPMPVAGHSMGAMIALRLAVRRPDLVSGVAVMASAPDPEPKELALLADMAALYPLIAPELWFRLLFQWLFAPPFFRDAEAVAGAAAAAAAYPYRQAPERFAAQVRALQALPRLAVADLPVPCLALVGSEDVLIRPEATFAALAGVRELRRVTIEGAGHSLHWDRPAEVAAALLEFLRDV